MQAFDLVAQRSTGAAFARREHDGSGGQDEEDQEGEQGDQQQDQRHPRPTDEGGIEGVSITRATLRRRLETRQC